MSAMTNTGSVDRAFIRRGIELADLNAVRVALYQHTHDPELATLPMAAKLDEGQRELLIEKAVDWLEVNAGPGMPDEPPVEELRKLMDIATQEETNDLDFEARRELPAFKPFPLATTWTGEKPEIPDDFHVVIIGSGFSGLTMAVQCRLLGVPYTAIERRPEPGGTWSINRYPDIRVDTLSITYEFAFEKEHRWSEYFGRGAEVREYLDNVSKKFGVYENTQFNSDLKQASWDDDRNLWVLEIETPDGVHTLETRVLVSAQGTFANARIPQFEGRDEFPGEILHPSQWPADTDLAGKRVAVIGNGSTGVQLLSAIAAEADHVHVIQRTPQWISPRANYGAPIEPEIRWLLDNFSGYWNWWRYMSIAVHFGTHGFIKLDEDWIAKGGKVNAMSDQLRADLTEYIKVQTDGDQELIDQLIPDYAPFSRRPVVDNGWYKSLTRDNVELVTDGIARLTPKGIELADGRELEIDVLVTATGFEVAKYLWPADYQGADGTSIHDFWSEDGPRAYLGMMVPNYPNFFMLYGPNSQPVSGGTGLPIWYVVWASYIGQQIVRMIEHGNAKVEVTRAAFEQYNKELDAEAAQLLILQNEGAPDKNYYVNDFGRLQVNAPWYGPEFHRMCTQVDWDAIEHS